MDPEDRGGQAIVVNVRTYARSLLHPHRTASSSCWALRRFRTHSVCQLLGAVLRGRARITCRNAFCVWCVHAELPQAIVGHRERECPSPRWACPLQEAVLRGRARLKTQRVCAHLLSVCAHCLRQSCVDAANYKCTSACADQLLEAARRGCSNPRAHFWSFATRAWILRTEGVKQLLSTSRRTLGAWYIHTGLPQGIVGHMQTHLESGASTQECLLQWAHPFRRLAHTLCAPIA